MSDTSKDIAVLLVRELEGFRREIDSFPDDQTVWQMAVWRDERCRRNLAPMSPATFNTSVGRRAGWVGLRS